MRFARIRLTVVFFAWLRCLRISNGAPQSALPTLDLFFDFALVA
jgi:hypothetical protein